MVHGVDDFLVSFGNQGNASSFCTTGWASPENGETWCVGNLGRLVIPAPMSAGTYVMVAHIRPNVFSARLTSQRLGVRVNGIAVADFVLERRTVRAWLLPWHMIAGRRDLQIEFDLPDAAPPSDFTDSADRRKLSVAFSSLQLYQDTSEVWRTDSFLGSDDPVPIDLGAVMAADQLPLNLLMLQFESIGQNCEFGLVQRACSAEPLGLLRFSSTPLPQLLTALDARFEGMGAPENTKVEISSSGREFMVKDTRFGIVSHAWVKTGEMEHEDLHQREVKRVPFLVRKLTEDLQVAEKTFVFKGMGAMPEEEVFPLVTAIRRYGLNTLLFVTLADENHQAGTVEARAPGFLVGYLDRFAPRDNASGFGLSQWVTICRKSYRLRLAKVPVEAKR